MARIYNAPSEIKLPEFNWKDLKASKEAELKYEADLKQYLIERNARERKDITDVGEILSFPVADGYARYMLARMEPLELIHIALDDAYEFQYVGRLTVADVKDKIKSNKELAELFAKRKQG